METAVEWLQEKISYTTPSGNIITYHGDMTKVFEEAKEMEKEQLKQLMWDLTEIDMTKSNKGLIIDNRFDNYWNETFKSE